MNSNGDRNRKLLSPERADYVKFAIGNQTEISISGLLFIGLIAGLLGPYVVKNFEDSILCLKIAALSYWLSTLWACIMPWWINKTRPMNRRWRKVLAVAAIAGVPALAPFTSLLEPVREHPKVLGISSCLFYLFAGAVLCVAWFIATKSPNSQMQSEAPACTRSRASP